VRRRGTAILASHAVGSATDGSALAAAGAHDLPELWAEARGRAGIAELGSALARRDPGSAASANRLLAGLGPGATPAGDDLLAAAAATVAVLGAAAGMSAGHRAAWLCAIAPAADDDRTTPLAATLRELAARGIVMEPLHGLLDLSPAAEARLRDALAEARGVGRSTGRAYSVGVGGAALALSRIR
jgi:hypothetical protein